jgi:hypothetical protein
LWRTSIVCWEIERERERESVCVCDVREWSREGEFVWGIIWWVGCKRLEKSSRQQHTHTHTYKHTWQFAYLSNGRPSVSKSGMCMNKKFFFFTGPALLAYVGLQMIHPSLSALFAWPICKFPPLPNNNNNKNTPTPTPTPTHILISLHCSLPCT